MVTGGKNRVASGEVPPRRYFAPRNETTVYGNNGLDLSHRVRECQDTMQRTTLLPLWLKIVFTVFVLGWTPLVVATQGWQNFLWLCDVANFLVLAGLWLESRLLISSQLVGTLLIGLAWTIDLLTAIVAGIHPFGATAYMFDPGLSTVLRFSSLFHIAVPLLLLFAARRLGHHRRGWRLETLICWVVLPLTAGLTDPERNINLIQAPFGVQQVWLPDWLYVLVCMAAYPLIVYLPTEFVLRRFLNSAPPRLSS